MNRRWIAMALVAGTLAACKRSAPEAVHVDPSLEVLVPSDTTMLAGIRFDRLKDTPLYQKLIEPNLPERIQEFATQTGVNPRKDLYEALLANTGNEPVVFLRGKFSRDEREPKISGPDIKREPYRGYALIGNERGVVAFLNPTVAVVGRPAGVKKVIDGREAKQVGPSKELRQRIDKIPYENQIWAVAVGMNQQATRLPMGGQSELVMPLLNAAQAYVLSVYVGTGLRLHGEAEAKSAEEAKKLHDAGRGILGLARLQAPRDQPELLQLFDGVRVSQEGAKAVLDAQFSEQQINEVSAMYRKFRPR